MHKSLRNQLFVQTLICLAVIVAGNRLLSRFVAEKYVTHQVEQNMATALRQCQAWLSDAQHFQTCATDAAADSLAEKLSHTLVLCAEALPAAGRDAACSALQDRPLQWQSVTGFEAPVLEQATAVLQGQVWRVYRSPQSGPGTWLLLQQARLDRFIGSIWNIRDQVFLYVVPLMVLAMGFLSWFVIRQLMQPLNQVKSVLSGLSSSNLDQPVRIANPHREFVGVIATIEALRRRLHASFQQAQRFSADASHELRTPLTILRGQVEQAIADLPAGSETQVRLRIMEEEIGRLVDVTEKLLLLSRADAEAIELERVRVDFSDFLHELVGDATSFDTELTVTAQIAPGIVWLCDVLLVRQLLLNLYTNAVNYNVDGGWVHFTAAQAHGRLELTVENACLDFSAELADRAFDRFYRGNAARTRQTGGQGLGLGLSLCREIAHLHGGTLTLEPSGPNRVCARLSVPLQA